MLLKESKLRRKPRLLWSIVLLMLAPLVLYPMVCLLGVSGQPPGGLAESAYTSVFSDPTFWQSVVVTYRLALISTAITALLGLLIALALYFSQLKASRVFMRSIELIVAFPSFLIAFSLIYLYGTEGAVTVGLERLFNLPQNSLQFLYGTGGILLAEVTYYLPFMIRPTIAVLELLDNSLLEAASALGSSPWRTLWRVVMPLTRIGIAAGVLLCFLFIQSEFGILLILGTQAIPTLPISIYSDAVINLNLPRAAVEASFMMIVSLVMYGLYRWLLSRGGTGATANTTRSTLGTAFLGRPKAGVLPGWGAIVIVTLLFLLPAAVVFISAFASAWVGTILPQAYTLRWFADIDASSWSSLETSVEVATAVALLSVLIGTLAALILSRFSGVIGHALDFLLMVPNALPSVVLGLAVLLAYHAPPFNLASSPLIVLLAQAALTLPFCYRTIQAALLKQPAEYVEAAAGLGASPWSTFWKVTLPMLEPALRAAFAVTFTFSMGELGATLMVYPPGFSTGPIEMIQDIERGFYYQGSALAAVLLTITFICLIVIAWLRPIALIRWIRRLQQRRRRGDDGAWEGDQQAA